jgi:hypothetical protein
MHKILGIEILNWSLIKYTSLIVVYFIIQKLYCVGLGNGKLNLCVSSSIMMLTLKPPSNIFHQFFCQFEPKI